MGSHRGLSDLSAVKRGQTIYIETKRRDWKPVKNGKKTRTQRDQEKFRDGIRRAGAMYLLVRSLEEFVADLETVENRLFPGQAVTRLFR
jgi:hypothetical protein